MDQVGTVNRTIRNKEVSMRIPRRVLFVRPETFIRVLDTHNLSHARFAEHLQVSRSYWSQLLNGRRRLSPEVRSRMLESRYLKGIPESSLWSETRPEMEVAHG